MEQIEDKKAKLNESRRKSYLKHKQQQNEKSKNYYHSNKEELLRKQKEYRAKNKDRIAQRKKEYRENNKDKEKQKQKEYRLKNRDIIIQKLKEYRSKNREEIAKKNKENYDPVLRRQRYEIRKVDVSEKSKEYYIKNKNNIKFKHFTYRVNNRDKSKLYYINKRYGIGAEEYEKMKLRQENKCAICGIHADDTKRKILYVDHDHKTGYVRSLLCSDCNSGIGFLKENEDIFMKAIQYIKKFTP